MRQEYLSAAAAGTPRRGQGPAGTEVELASAALDRARSARAAQLAGLERRYAAGQPRRGRAAGIEDYCLVRQARAKLEAARQRQAAAAARAAQKQQDRKGPGPVRNTTDPGSRLMHVRGGGFIQGYNAQNVAALITASRASGSGNDSDDEQIGLLLADAGYLSEHNLTIEGPDRLIATGRSRDLDKAAAGHPPGGGWNRTGPATRAMAARLATDEGIAAYRHRGHISETPHGDLKHNKRFRQLSVRGLPRASAEWQFAAAVLNLSKAITSGHLTHAALNALTSQAT